MDAVRRTSGAEVVHEELRRRVMAHELAPGTRLHEVELAASLGVSRTPLREALRMLLADGFVQQLPTGGLVVSPLDDDDMRELYEVRSVIEGLVARQAAADPPPADLAVLAGFVAQMELLVDYPDEMVRLGGLFHRHLLAMSGNGRAEQLLASLRGHLHRYHVMTAQVPERRREAYAEHRGVYDAVRAGDTEEAERLMREHIMAAYTRGLQRTG